MSPEALRANWNAAWRALDVAAPDEALCAELQQRYGEPQRHYHTMQHLGECLAWFEREEALAEHPGEVALALWFHDAIYDVHAHDNEARSADWARQALLAAGVNAEAAERVHALVMATRHDAVPEGRDAELLIDIDLSILGAGRERFDEYERQVHAEYAFVPEEVRLPRRRDILQRFLDRKAIYATPRMHAQLEAQARINLQRSIAG
ncbi:MULTISPECIES: HD domain-containing protein [Variovorax]|uniref:HD domain-containing protein n=1 Tax=Variovorax TaxID=34072 RepID=UPI00086EE956|nr:N-methyl-D-aspartate receptor NMDAR2C subunit [Variovorax paradoxus]MBN8756716.1 N-methyl-D-aspartate receptor NMDAR2C subunit [Variovorax sp.]ODU15791.1 MAG: N-methyl-D-aspartate receptor NMDAR2C subunit [Variovorax sp. SCN 67-85]ODV20203.1 MAG: N-methyl-D-aspartate receptor NMDAR2C subunit [Variovorax sp. SCN 67-20]OJZ11692.1 MAG: N-methyl-D-aspartate receptor NMDAR2C subunit [Variovorax sp. 67-131]UKI05729.1 N-methyl-D-aspartate receptor NMDAR2C subunit [Variovorax paradoxus]